MTLIEALKTNKPIKRPKHINPVIQYFEPNTGPDSDLVTCDYFRLREDGDNVWYFSTSVDLYPEDLFATDWSVYEAK